MSGQLLNLAIPLIGMQIARKIPFDDPQVLTGMRMAYILSQLSCLSIYYYTASKIKSKNDTTVLKYVEPKAPMSPDQAKLVTTTVRDYDLNQISTGLRSVMMGVLMMLFLHLYMKYDAPLFLQSLMPLKTTYENKVIQIHLLGRSATGDLKRPFKTGGFMGAATDAKTDAKSIKEAEKSSVKKDQ
ncbi:inorganic phosphate transporter Pho88 [Phakopsora pachyrhizi]|uniref:Inorganic phosphate transporter Pho88 n=1 Tax=Phakopsora pachyrhizi TaxID=170000 RepID=A0AAV0BU96_PHAPC|nr:inorganic phosphate transporter Pho88 [Phakopsora pachyrhizi]KAI8444130.1 inorganic phosphate transporter Pho88 [Phakopsora pachyrhizi]CAH7690972.1 inorganic phosphate transporter Pho88 [Phakopsora pachyrhizi]